MQLSVFAFKILLIFFPGIICSYIVDTFSIHKERTQFQFLVNSFVLGLSSYLLYWLTINLIGMWFNLNETNIEFLRSISDAGQTISYKEIAYVTIISVLLGIFITIVDTYKLHFRLMRKLRVTKKFGEIDVWG